jgi:hypothetical protein
LLYGQNTVIVSLPTINKFVKFNFFSRYLICNSTPPYFILNSSRKLYTYLFYFDFVSICRGGPYFFLRPVC